VASLTTILTLIKSPGPKLFSGVPVPVPPEKLIGVNVVVLQLPLELDETSSLELDDKLALEFDDAHGPGQGGGLKPGGSGACSKPHDV
jgi:hypothetical protein